MKSKSTKHQVLIIEDDFVYIREYPGLIASSGDFEVTKIIDFDSDYTAELQETKPDIIITDMRDGISGWQAGLAAIRTIRSIHATIPIIAVSSYDDLLDQAIEVGANAALLKGDLNDLFATMRRLIDSDRPPSRAHENDKSGSLPDYLRPILNAFSAGYTSDKAIVARTRLKASTVKAYVRDLREFLGVNSRSQIIPRAVSMGLIPKSSLRDDTY